MASQDDTLKAQAQRVTRHLQRFTAEQRANRAASHRLGHRQRTSVGEYFYTHPDAPGRAFTSRTAAARAGLTAIEAAPRAASTAAGRSSGS